ncbi:MAG: amino-acid N-acetyltransferase [Mariniblastus sp.]|jgi:amino-acid N-acetyltransferase
MEEPELAICSAGTDDLEAVQNFLEPFMDDRQLLRRTSLELELLLKHAFQAVSESRIVAFCALEIYSKKLAEIQCLAVDESFRRQGIGAELVKRCVQRARDEKVKELLAISASEEMFKSCGFDYSLPNQKKALFIQP